MRHKDIAGRVVVVVAVVVFPLITPTAMKKCHEAVKVQLFC